MILFDRKQGVTGFILYVPCPHVHVTFMGMYSLVGNYECHGCGAKIDPQEYLRPPHHSPGTKTTWDEWWEYQQLLEATYPEEPEK